MILFNLYGIIFVIRCDCYSQFFFEAHNRISIRKTELENWINFSSLATIAFWDIILGLTTSETVNISEHNKPGLVEACGFVFKTKFSFHSIVSVYCERKKSLDENYKVLKLLIKKILARFVRVFNLLHQLVQWKVLELAFSGNKTLFINWSAESKKFLARFARVTNLTCVTR